MRNDEENMSQSESDTDTASLPSNYSLYDNPYLQEYVFVDDDDELLASETQSHQERLGSNRLSSPAVDNGANTAAQHFLPFMRPPTLTRLSSIDVNCRRVPMRVSLADIVPLRYLQVHCSILTIVGLLQMIMQAAIVSEESYNPDDYAGI